MNRTSTSTPTFVRPAAGGGRPRAGSNVANEFRTIAALDAASAAEIEAWQTERIAALVRHARAQSAWWRARLPEADDAPFETFPLTDRNAYRDSVASGPLEVGPGRGKPSENTTSGSSGVAVRFWSCGASGRMNLAHYAYDRMRHRLSPQKVRASLNPRVAIHEGEHVSLNDGLLLQRRARQFTIEEHARWLSRTAPAYLTTMPTILRGMLDVFESGEVAAPRIEAFLTYGETVEPELRRRARAATGARVLDRYSCEELGPLAFQCPRDETRMHVAVANAKIEILDENGAPCRDGEVGRVYVTGLQNYASPAIRYELGDLAAMRQGCRCGFRGPVIDRMLGRKRFLIRLPSGERTMAGSSSKLWLKAAPIREQRLVQVSEGVVRAEVVLDRPLSDEERERIVALLREELHPDLAYEVVQLDAIDWGPTYKRQDVVSLI